MQAAAAAFGGSGAAAMGPVGTFFLALPAAMKLGEAITMLLAAKEARNAVQKGYLRVTSNGVKLATATQEMFVQVLGPAGNIMYNWRYTSFTLITYILSLVTLSRSGGEAGKKVSDAMAEGGIETVKLLPRLVKWLWAHGGPKAFERVGKLYIFFAKVRSPKEAQAKIEAKIETLDNAKVNTPAKSPGRLKLENELAELKLMLQQIKNRQTPLSPVKIKTPSPIKLTPKSPSPNYIYVGGRKIPLRRKPMSPAKAKEGRLRKVVRRVLHGRTEEEKMMKLAKALRKRALAASARSRSASAARSRSRSV